MNETITKDCTSFSFDKFIKECIGIIVDEICWEWKNSPENMCLYYHTIIKWIEDLSHEFQGALEKKISQCDF